MQWAVMLNDHHLQYLQPCRQQWAIHSEDLNHCCVAFQVLQPAVLNY